MLTLLRFNKALSLAFLVVAIQLLGTSAAALDFDTMDEAELVTMKKPHFSHSRRYPNSLLSFSIDLDTLLEEYSESVETSVEDQRRRKRSTSRSNGPVLFCGGYTKKVCQLICGVNKRRHFWCSSSKCVCHGAAVP